MNVKIRYQNRNDAEYEEIFDELIRDTFGFSFMPWFEQNLWDERYESFSLIEDGKMLSNICLFKAELEINGGMQNAYQLGAVATRKSERGKGLSKKLMQHVLDTYPNAPMFLFANESAMDFYPRFGFRRIFESKPSCACLIENPNVSANRLSPRHPLVKKYLMSNRKVSNALHCGKIETVEMFHLLLSHNDEIYHIPLLDALVVAKADGTDLFISYINKPEAVSFDVLVPHLPFCGIRTVSFGFMPDLLMLPCRWERLESGDESMFIRGDIALPEPFAFPALAKT